MIKKAISKIIKNQDLSESEMIGVMNEIMRGNNREEIIGTATIKFMVSARQRHEILIQA